MNIHIYDIECPNCKEIVWVNNGDVDDLTVDDVEAVICPHCEHKWLLEGCEDWTTFDEANTVRAGKTIKDVV